MRIAIVSAHYPPNFVSGGTLVPQRIAEHLAARGHQVFVFAGELQADRPDLMTHVEMVPSNGSTIEVTWVSMTGRLAWNDRRNYSGPDMDALFGAFLRRVRPDAVHLHSLQGLGAGLVPLAAASGAATVVTMHDMWWWCARQFLVEQNLRPCRTVVDAGVCACAVDNDWLRARNAELAAQLSAADLVLAPSRPMLELLAANGVDPARLALDENPSPDSVRDQPARAPRATGDVRFVFAGGKHAVKGGPLALQAAGQLKDLPGWSLDLFGIEQKRLPRHTRALPPFRPGEVSQVLSGYDVLVMSSVMLESYSLLTREALAAGCVVITGDNPGPVEVVRDGVNGLVVPRGDARALAAAMRSLITDPDLLDRLRPAPGELILRSQEEQAAGLETHFQRLLDSRPRPGAAAERPLQRVLLISGITGAPLRYRGFLPAEALAGVGIHVDVMMYRDARVPELAATADAVILYRVPATSQILEVITAVRARPEPVPILFDIDDLIVDPGLADELNPILSALPDMDLELYWRGVRRYRTTLEACDGYIGSTKYLCDRIAALTGLPTYRFANGVGRELARVSDAQLRRPRKPGPTRIGYFSGTNTHNEDWAHIEPALIELLGARPEVQLWIGGILGTSDALLPFAGRISRLPFARWFELPALLRDLDVNLAPLESGRTFNEAKSAIKFVEAALVATPTVASPSEPFREVITDGVNGLLASGTEEWLQALTRLVDDPTLRSRLGQAALEGVLSDLSPARQGYRYRDILLTARGLVEQTGHHTGNVDWPPEVADEPWSATATEFYGPLDIRPDGSIRSPRTPGTARRYAAAARSLIEREGVAATVKRGVQEIRSRLG